MTAVNDVIIRIVGNPGIGALSASGHRWVKTKRFAYIIHYAHPSPGTIEVFAVSHVRRRPGYWLGRTSRS